MVDLRGLYAVPRLNWSCPYECPSPAPRHCARQLWARREGRQDDQFPTPIMADNGSALGCWYRPGGAYCLMVWLLR